jgi:hypothetical protein
VTFAHTIVGRFHQTSVSAAIRKTPGVDRLAARWWRRVQADAFLKAFASLRGPIYPALHGVSTPSADVPTPIEILSRDPGTVEIGGQFTSDMSEWCRTSKFETLGYQDVYGRTLAHLRLHPIVVLEIGIGINDPTVPSGMHADHAMGSSLRGWSHYFPQGDIHGADVDRRTLLDDGRYRTHFVDQRDLSSLLGLAEEVPSPLDLVIDDGLHTPEANAKTVIALLPHISPEGVLVVEDILPEFDFLWQGLGDYLRAEYRVTFFPADALYQQRVPGSECGMAVFTRVVE